ncbi:ADP-ribose pyrophosphatase YjhB (NUDIX family) [Microbacterium sp. SLBN-154]|uniref:DUF4916 domain-containing protein n=1 Tax=Microbacterium sp. SLBN-154 TaxID=2768458 RepID=UPI0011734F9A|nr:DUF4916 domain-containing protein [Microbacterium sp. SLBN-154]TQK18619.1 ADP-ribose pyrophosphatase YjhB (NUDIX family) [Microbacterium sp. SLBN-154]
MTYLPAERYRLVEDTMPIACVDFFPQQPDTRAEVGLILRDSPFGKVWCHLGGRILRGESIRQALLRHAKDTLDVTLRLPRDPQPLDVYQWFPPDDTPADSDDHGVDPRKHAIGLSFIIELEGAPEPRNEADDFAWFPSEDLPAPLWPGTEPLLRRLLTRHSAT